MFSVSLKLITGFGAASLVFSQLFVIYDALQDACSTRMSTIAWSAVGMCASAYLCVSTGVHQLARNSANLPPALLDSFWPMPNDLHDLVIGIYWQSPQPCVSGCDSLLAAMATASWNVWSANSVLRSVYNVPVVTIIGTEKWSLHQLLLWLHGGKRLSHHCPV